jgi:hypothetical protein
VYDNARTMPSATKALLMLNMVSWKDVIYYEQESIIMMIKHMKLSNPKS